MGNHDGTSVASGAYRKDDLGESPPLALHKSVPGLPIMLSPTPGQPSRLIPRKKRVHLLRGEPRPLPVVHRAQAVVNFDGGAALGSHQLRHLPGPPQRRGGNDAHTLGRQNLQNTRNVRPGGIGNPRVHPAGELGPRPVRADHIHRNCVHRLGVRTAEHRRWNDNCCREMYQERHEVTGGSHDRQHGGVAVDVDAEVDVGLQAQLSQGHGGRQLLEVLGEGVAPRGLQGPEHGGGGVVQDEAGGRLGLLDQRPQYRRRAELIIRRPCLPPVRAAAHQQDRGHRVHVEENGLHHRLDVEEGPQHQQLAPADPGHRPRPVGGHEQAGLPRGPLQVAPGAVVLVEPRDERPLLLPSQDDVPPVVPRLRVLHRQDVRQQLRGVEPLPHGGDHGAGRAQHVDQHHQAVPQVVLGLEQLGERDHGDHPPLRPGLRRRVPARPGLHGPCGHGRRAVPVVVPAEPRGLAGHGLLVGPRHLRARRHQHPRGLQRPLAVPGDGGQLDGDVVGLRRELEHQDAPAGHRAPAALLEPLLLGLPGDLGDDRGHAREVGHQHHADLAVRGGVLAHAVEQRPRPGESLVEGLAAVVGVGAVSAPGLPLTRKMCPHIIHGQARPVPPVDRTELRINLRHQPVRPGHQLRHGRAPQQRRGEHSHHRLHGHPVRRHLGLLYPPLRQAGVGDPGHGAVLHPHVLPVADDQHAEPAADLGGRAAAGHALRPGEAVLPRWQRRVQQGVTDLMAKIHRAGHERVKRRQIHRQHVAERVHLQAVRRVPPARAGRHRGEQGRRGAQLEASL
mmetsp:Transcript_71810/g.191554  ORF Transcript_71810/g.191554 Transcript_71810/m.191554 type:complete len:787 (-) Transcript_71810:735-3095(-)